MTWWIRVQSSVTDTEPSETLPSRGTSTSRYHRFSTLTKLLMSLSRYYDKFRREPPRPRHLSINDVQGEAINKNSLSEGKNAVNIYLELDGLDDVTEDAFKAESGKTKCVSDCKYNTSNDMFSRCKSVQKMATGKSDDQIIQPDNNVCHPSHPHVLMK